MALHWSLSKIKDKETVCFYEKDGARTMKGATEALIWATMIIGLPDITEKNAEEFYFRIRFYERAQGALRNMMSADGEGITPVFFSADEVRKHIGLCTNASRETRHAWIKRMSKRIDIDAKREWKAALAADNAAVAAGGQA